MRFTKKQLLLLTIVLIFMVFLTNYKLDYYIYQPGSLYALDEVVEVENSFDSEGELHLVTVRGGQATPLYYLWAKIRPHYEIFDLEQIRPDGISQEEYLETQLHYMESSQEAALVVAFEAAGKDIDIVYEGVYVMTVVNNMPANDHLQVGDQIVEVAGTEVASADEVVEYTSSLGVGDVIELKVLRSDEQLDVAFELAPFPDDPDRAGMGVGLVTDRTVTVNPSVNFNSGSIGGPSAGLMMSLEIFNQLTADDITKGYKVAGTGEVDYAGNVYRIGGVDKKVVAAHRSGAHVFFAPHEGGREGSNYELAVRTAEEIGTEMQIVPVDTFEDAMNYLLELPPYEG